MDEMLNEMSREDLMKYIAEVREQQYVNKKDLDDVYQARIQEVVDKNADVENALCDLSELIMQ